MGPTEQSRNLRVEASIQTKLSGFGRIDFGLGSGFHRGIGWGQARVGGMGLVWVLTAGI